MLNSADLAGLPETFQMYMGKAIEIILTGHFYSVTIDPSSVGANTTSEQTFTVNGLRQSDVVIVNKPSHTTGLGIAGCRVSGKGQLAITFINTTGSPINPASESYKVLAIRREHE